MDHQLKTTRLIIMFVFVVVLIYAVLWFKGELCVLVALLV